MEELNRLTILRQLLSEVCIAHLLFAEPERRAIVSTMFDRFTTTPARIMLTDAGIIELTNQIFDTNTNPDAAVCISALFDITDKFILRYQATLGPKDHAQSELTDLLAKSLGDTDDYDTNAGLVNHDFLENTTITQTEIITLCLNNRWLITVLLMNILDTGIDLYKAVKEVSKG